MVVAPMQFMLTAAKAVIWGHLWPANTTLNANFPAAKLAGLTASSAFAVIRIQLTNQLLTQCQLVPGQRQDLIARCSTKACPKRNVQERERHLLFETVSEQDVTQLQRFLGAMQPAGLCCRIPSSPTKSGRSGRKGWKGCRSKWNM